MLYSKCGLLGILSPPLLSPKRVDYCLRGSWPVMRIGRRGVFVPVERRDSYYLLSLSRVAFRVPTKF